MSGSEEQIEVSLVFY